MSRETLEWLNLYTLIGYTEDRGHAWHWKAENQGDESNHYPGAIPADDVIRRLFNWTAVEGRGTWTATLADGQVLTVEDPDRKAIMRSDTGLVLGVFKDGYEIHDYRTWLLDEVSRICSGDLGIGSAGLLKRGGVAWVQFERPDTIVLPEGVEFRPHLLATTSIDGTIATTYGNTITNKVCDNTHEIARGEMGDQKVKVKHTKYSKVKLLEARTALGLIDQAAEGFAAEVAELCKVTVTDDQWAKFLDSLCPLPEADGRGKTMAVNKRDTINHLYHHDSRCKPWEGTGWGVVQSVNTYAIHEAGVKRTANSFDLTDDQLRQERAMENTLSGKLGQLDQNSIHLLMAAVA